VPLPYDTPKMLGGKWQMDVKFVPKKCAKFPANLDRWYQYTILDEAGRERFLYHYREHSTHSTVDFLRRAFIAIGYIPYEIQTDNGTEFVNRHTGVNATDKLNLVEEYLKSLKIKYKQIRVATPRHNGKVERSHRTDNATYKNFTFSTFEELRAFGEQKMYLYNNAPNRMLRSRHNRNYRMSPYEARQELLQELKQWCIDQNFRPKSLQDVLNKYHGKVT
jgi:hypothetical protein